jgi:anaerobic C4-dicarboxylate transporter DcuB
LSVNVRVRVRRWAAEGEENDVDTALILLQGAVVIIAILLGVRTGGIGLGLWGLVGLAILVFLFGLPPGDPPTSSMFIILMVITAASTMQSVGGIDYLVNVARAILKRNPAYITVVAPLVAFVFTMGAGTGFIYYPLIPVIFAVAYANRVRPERPLGVAGTASQFAITASPVSAAMAALVGLLEPVGFDIGDILIVIVPASVIAVLVASVIEMKWGPELEDDPEYQRRLAAGEIQPIDLAVLESKELPPEARRSTLIFLAGIAVIVLLAMIEKLRPAFPNEAGEMVPLSTSIVIQIVMGVTATIIVLTCGVKIKEVVTQSTMTSGLVGLIALFGIAWLADTWISANETAIVNAMGDIVDQWKWFIAIAIFIVGALTTSQAAAISAIVPIGLALGVAPQYLAAFSLACIGIYFFPANGSQVTSIATDETGTTRISKYAIWHSFSLPMFVMWLVGTVIAMVVATIGWGTS